MLQRDSLPIKIKLITHLISMQITYGSLDIIL